MKKSILGFLFLIQAGFGFSQIHTGGIYASAEDFGQNKFSFPFSCDSGKTKINLRSGKQLVTVTHKDVVHQFKLSEVFGFEDCSGKTFRIYKNDAYELMNREAIFLYAQGAIKNKSATLEISYFFSVSAESSLFPLTIQSLNKAFASHSEFLNAININFKEDADLLQIDPFKKQYKLIQLFNKSHD